MPEQHIKDWSTPSLKDKWERTWRHMWMTEPEMIKDVEETLLTLKKVNTKLNLKKCSFGMEEGKFLGYIVTSEGIRANPEKAKAIVNMPSPSNLKQMQRLSGKLTALNRFLSKAAEKALPCLDTLKKEEQDAPESKTPKNLGTETDIWKLYTNGASNKHGSGAGLILIDLEGAKYSYAIRLNFTNSNNDAKYEALLAGLRIATKMKVKKNSCIYGFEIGSKQATILGGGDHNNCRGGSYEEKSEKTKKYKEKALEMICSFNNFQISHIPREDNKKDGALRNLAAVQCEGLTNGVLIEELNERSVDTVEVNISLKKQQESWLDTILRILLNLEILPKMLPGI
ncbi:reverse transcriptase domain-containing protein [Tanacetum coccineum]